MEIGTGKVALFWHGDAAVFVRTQADALDRTMFEALTKSAARALMAGEVPKLSRDLARVFVCGWDNVMLDGLRVPYSWQLLEAIFPPEAAEELYKFVARSVDILKQ